MTTESNMNIVCITTNQPDTKSNPNPNPSPSMKQHAIVKIQLNIRCGPKSKSLPNYQKIVLSRIKVCQ